MNKQLAIAGFHRSGTSMVAELFHNAGLFLGFDLLEPTESNKHGHFEDWDIMQFHNSLLDELGMNWKFTEGLLPHYSESNILDAIDLINHRNLWYKVWGFKDPRICLFLELWKGLLPDLKLVIVYRHYIRCASSLFKRHMLDILTCNGDAPQHLLFWQDPGLAFEMWLINNVRLIEFAKRYPNDCLLVSHDAILHGYPVVSKANEKFDLGLNGKLSRTIDNDLTTLQVPKAMLSSELISKLDKVWHDLNEIARSQDPHAATDISPDLSTLQARPNEAYMKMELEEFHHIHKKLTSSVGRL